jgi:endoglucanase
MKYFFFSFCIFLFFSSFRFPPQTKAWIRINQLGYIPNGIKVAVWCSKDQLTVESWQLIEVNSNKIVYLGKFEKPFGVYGPFTQTYRLNFSSFKKPGRFFFLGGVTP